jgi:hypothetical protein
VIEKVGRSFYYIYYLLFLLMHVSGSGARTTVRGCGYGSIVAISFSRTFSRKILAG